MSSTITQIPDEIRDGFQQIDARLLALTRQAYEDVQLNPEKGSFETSIIDLSEVKPQIDIPGIPGIGTFTIGVYVSRPLFIPIGLGLFIPQSTAKNLEKIGTAAAAAVTAAIITASKNLQPWAPLIAGVLANVFNSLPNFIDRTCGAQGGGFTVNFILPVPVPFCGALPAFPL